MEKVTVIIVNYNAGPLLRQAVQAVLCSEAVSKVIIVDNHSTDGSMDAMERLAVSQPRLICIRNKENFGFAKACNIGVEAAGNGEYLLFLNPDCLMESKALETLLAFMKSSPKTGMAGPLLLNPDGTEQAGGRRAVPTPWRSFVRAFGLSKLGQRYPRLFSDFHCINSLCRLVRKRWKPFPVPACSSGVKLYPMSAPWMKIILCTAKIWTGACVFVKGVGRLCLCLMPA